MTKPGEWANVPDEDFLDPVNYRYPCPNADQVRAAAGYWGHPDNQAQYSSEEKAIINKRLDAMEKKFKIGSHNPQKGGTKMKEFIEKLKALVLGAEKEINSTDGQPAPAPGPKFTEADLAAAEKRGKDAEAGRLFAENEKLKKEKADAEAKVKEIERQKQKDGIAAFCEAQCKEGKLTPALRKIIEPIMIAVAHWPEANATIEFQEGSAGVPPVKKTALEGIKDFLTELPKVVTFKEVVTKDGPGSGGSASDKLGALMKKKMEEKKDLSYGMAFAEVQKENIDLAKEALAEIRPSTK